MQSLENLQVRNKEDVEEEIEANQKKHLYKSNKIFDKAGIKTTSDFLHSYFNKEPQMFESIKLKQRMAKVRKEVA